MQKALNGVGEARAALEALPEFDGNDASAEFLRREKNQLVTQIMTKSRSWKTPAPDDIATLRDRLDPRAARSGDAATVHEGLRQLYVTLDEIRSVLTARIEPETEVLAQLVQEARGLDLKRQANLDMLISAKMAATQIIRRDLPAAGESTDSPLMAQLAAYNTTSAT